MSEWSDTRIIIAAATGVLLVLSSFGSLFLGISNERRARRNEKRTKNAENWEQYRETIVEPLRFSLRKLRDPIQTIFSWIHDCPPSGEKRKEFFVHLSTLLNEIEVECAKADGHPRSLHHNLSAVAEVENQKIFDLIELNNMFDEESEKFIMNLKKLQDYLTSYDRIFEEHIRKQWCHMMKIS